ncbi:hypothetical protein Gohar_019788, partial [Gossypium harknessii]|nr:hypothetical protein [Gossypium harknessii]
MLLTSCLTRRNSSKSLQSQWRRWEPLEFSRGMQERLGRNVTLLT